MKENKMEFIKAIEDLCHKTRALQDLVIETGYINYGKKDRFDRSEFVVTDNADEATHLCFHWKEQSVLFGTRQSIEGDSNYGILCDAMKVIEHLA